jgi:regulator of sirC expression with transglutaminase-like and TPR domain
VADVGGFGSLRAPINFPHSFIIRIPVEKPLAVL